MTLPEEIADLAGQLYEVCKRYKVKSIKLTQYMGEQPSEMSQFTVEVGHPLGEVKAVKDPGYFCMPEDSAKIAPALSAGITRLVNRYQHELATAQSDLQSATEEITRCEESIETATKLDPGVLDQIVMAIEEPDIIAPLEGLGG